MMAFVRNREDFICGHCGSSVMGDGYTNHCTKCLWSKHVDVQPGDRAASCGGMMKPVRIEGSTPVYVLIHECQTCKLERRNKVQRQDEPAAIIALANAKK